MNIKEININDLKEYENNPRNNDEAVEPVANSIKEFGFKVPIVVDKNNVIVAGHTRYKAAKRLKLERVPCIVADDLNEEQIRAFRLADNKVGEIAEWDLELLNIELENIIDIDMTMFEFDFFDEEEKPTKEPKDLSDEIGETFEVIIECENELQQEEIFYRLSQEGLKCRVLTL